MFASCYITNQISDVQQMLVGGVNVIALTDDIEDFRHTPVMVASILLPPYESSEADTYGDEEAARNIYIQYLMRPETMKVFATILAALHAGKEICFYIPMDESTAFKFGRTLLEFMASQFGVLVGDGIGYGFPPNPSTNPDPMYESSRLNTMFLYDVIDLNTLAVEYPPGIIPNDMVCVKILTMYDQDFRNLSMEQIRDFVARYIMNIRSAIVDKRVAPMMRV